MRIGISVITREGQNIWSNGLGQNVIFLARLFQQLPFVQSVVFIDVGDQACMPPQVEAIGLDVPRLTTQEATDQVDVVIEMAGVLDPSWVKLMRARGKKVVYHCCGQPYVGLIEPAIFEQPGSFHPSERCDEVWLLPKDKEFAPLMRTLHRCAVHVAPYIWQAQFLKQRIDEVARLIGLHYGYQPRSCLSGPPTAGLRVVILEPNISVAKTSSIPMLVCDEAYRADASSVQMMNVLNTLHMTTHPTLQYLANSLDLVKNHKALFLGRHDIVGFMAEKADAVVSHQWLNDQNYSYLDVLYGNYPLIHNSPWLRDLAGAGYYYPGFDAAEGGRQLLHALNTHDTQLDDYRARSQMVFDAVDPSNPQNLEAYALLLQNLCRGTSFGVAA